MSDWEDAYRLIPHEEDDEPEQHDRGCRCDECCYQRAAANCYTEKDYHAL
jgi:hypothetical protein